ncbi:MAG: hypothetical protein ABH811_02755, partial [archaeon]
SFGMIFSIILIIVFISFAFYVIKILIEGQQRDTIFLFKEDLQNDIDKIWRGSGSLSRPGGYSLPKKIEYACFVDFSYRERGENKELYSKLKRAFEEYENLIFYPVGSTEGVDAFEIKHIDLITMTKNENPFCIENNDGKIELTIKRDYDQELVLIGR